MNLSESYKRRLRELGGIETSVSYKIILIRSKVDKNFMWDVYYRDSDKKIYKVEKNKGNFEPDDIFSDKQWFDFNMSLGLGQIVDFDSLRNNLEKFPDLYVKDIL